VPLAGGRQTAWRVGAVVLKPADLSPDHLAWQERLLTSLDGRDDFRVAPPLRSVDGELLVDGWTAWRFEPSAHQPARWGEIIEVSHHFHAAVRSVPRPAHLDDRDDRWAVADRVAWGALPSDPYPRAATVADALRLITAESQLIHGDLAGNVLFADGRPPLVIDLSPYWRPPAMAIAMIVVDALVFEGADETVLEHARGVPDFGQYLLRALLFRLVTDQLAGRESSDRTDPYAAAVQLALRMGR
jgi:uncharacterized protein (TIGR02569 family)